MPVCVAAVASDEAGGFAAAAPASGAAELPAVAVVVPDCPAVAWFAFCWLTSIEFEAVALDWLLMSVELVPVAGCEAADWFTSVDDALLAAVVPEAALWSVEDVALAEVAGAPAAAWSDELATGAEEPAAGAAELVAVVHLSASI